MPASRIQNTWSDASCFLDLKKACTSNGGIRHTFTLRRGIDFHADQWDQTVYVLIKNALLEPFSVSLGPNGRPYLHVYVPSREEVELMARENDGVHINIGQTSVNRSLSTTEDRITYKNFASVCNTAVKNYAGLALYTDRAKMTAPAMTMRFGALHSFLQYGDAGGPPQLVDNMIRAIHANPKNPKQAILDSTDKRHRAGEPSEAFFNEFLRILIRQELRMIIKNPELSVNFLLREQYMYALRHMIVLQPSARIGDAQRSTDIMRTLTWYMPLFLPLAYEAPDGLMDIFY